MAKKKVAKKKVTKKKVVKKKARKMRGGAIANDGKTGLAAAVSVGLSCGKESAMRKRSRRTPHLPQCGSFKHA